MLETSFFRTFTRFLLISCVLSSITSPCESKKGCCCEVGKDDFNWDWGGGIRDKCEAKNEKGRHVKGSCVPRSKCENKKKPSLKNLLKNIPHPA